MGSGMSPVMFLLYSVLFLQCFQASEGRVKIIQEMGHGHLRSSSSPQIEPELNVFFHYNNLKVGNNMPIYFPTKDPSTSPHLLSREESDSIPFSISQLPNILELLSFPESSNQAIAMRETLDHCEFPPLKGETKFCATSLEFMLDSIRGILGSKFKVLTTNYLSESISLLQNYTISEPPRTVSARKIVSCHSLPYPYAVFYCHSQKGDTELYKVSLVGEDGGRVEAAAICHMDTSMWDPSHVSFRVLRTVPGASPVCHFFPPDNLIWIPIS